MTHVDVSGPLISLGGPGENEESAVGQRDDSSRERGTDNGNYYRARAASERARAEASSNPAIAKIHNEMAGLYEAAAAQERRVGTLGIAVPVMNEESESGA